MTKTRKTYDWEAIEKEYRAGQLSIREIAKQHGCSDTAIRKRMKALGVERDLSSKVAQKVRSELVRESGCTGTPEIEQEIVDTAAARAVEVVRSHRKRISHGGEIVELLISQLKDVADNRAELEEEIEEATKDDNSPKRRITMERAVALPSNASTAVSLSLALKNLVGLERQAFNLNDTDGNVGEIEGIQIKLINAND